MAYLQFVKSKRKQYVYIRGYIGKVENKSREDEKIVSLGRIERALITLKMWEIDQKLIPKELPKRDYSNINKWINDVRKRGAY